ncbi:hypothetical protein [Streptomyces sp. NPDC055210]
MDNRQKIEYLEAEISGARAEQRQLQNEGHGWEPVIEAREKTINDALEELSYTIADERALRALDQHLPR